MPTTWTIVESFHEDMHIATGSGLGVVWDRPSSRVVRSSWFWRSWVVDFQDRWLWWGFSRFQRMVVDGGEEDGVDNCSRQWEDMRSRTKLYDENYKIDIMEDDEGDFRVLLTRINKLHQQHQYSLGLNANEIIVCWLGLDLYNETYTVERFGIKSFGLDTSLLGKLGNDAGTGRFDTTCERLNTLGILGEIV